MMGDMIKKLSLGRKKEVKNETQVKPELKEKEEKRDFTTGLVSTKDVIAPGSIEVDFDFIRIENKYYRTLFVASYPRFVGINWLSPLINFDASLNVSMYIYPTDGKQILDDLRRKITEMEAELSTDIQRGRIVNPATQAKLEDALNLQADLVKGEERFFQFGLYVTISADSVAELNRINKNLEAALGSLMIVSKKATLQMEEGFATNLPICSDRLDITRNMDTTSLATTFPFVSSDLSDDKGIMYGINEHNGSLVIFDRFGMPNYNSVVFASAGAGKSYMIKLEVMRSLMLGTEIMVIDPENEYKTMSDAVGGQYIAFGYGEESKINPFDLSLVSEDGENALNSKILSLHKLFKIMIGEMDPIEESIMDRAIMDAYKMKGITPDPETQTREAPLIEDMYKSLIGMEEEKAKGLAARFEKYIKGSFAGIFNQKTTVNLENKFVVFGIRNLEESLRPVAMHIILDYIWTVVKKNLKKRILVVDEAWYLMQYPDSAAFLRGIVKRGRKYYLGVTTITQDVDDFLETPYGKEIVTNSSIQILLKQHSAAIDKIGEVFYLSEGEKQLLLSADKGEGIFFAGQNHVAIKVIASKDEHKLITSNPEDVLRMKKEGLVPEKDLMKAEAGVAVQAGDIEEKAPIRPQEAPEAKKVEEVKEDPVVAKDDELERIKREIAEANQVKPELSYPKEEGVAQERPVVASEAPVVEKETPVIGEKSEVVEEAQTVSIPTGVKEIGKVEIKEAPKAEEEILSEVKSEEGVENKVNERPVRFETEVIGDHLAKKEEIVPQEIPAREEKTENPNSDLEKRIKEMEEKAKAEVEAHKLEEEKKMREIEEEKKKAEGNFGAGKLPSYKELFKSLDQNQNKLPPLPQIEEDDEDEDEESDFEEKKSGILFKPEVEEKKEEKKVVFVKENEEKKIPQPPQLQKKAKPEFVKEEKATGEEKKGEEEKKEVKDMDYDDLFGNGIV